MNLKDILTGIELLKPYYDDPEGYHLGADHDVIYLYRTNRPLPPETVKQLVELGWFQEHGANEDNLEAYDPDESWWGYV